MLAIRSGRLIGVAMAVALVGGLLLVSPVLAKPNPPGNNGTVKVDREPFDDHPNNEPHVGCTFQIDFYGFDEGDLNAEVTFEAHPPTLRPSGSQVLLTDTVFIGEDDNSGGGSQAGLDASETYTLDFTGITPHPVQGFHVKLTVHADGSKGADTKHKVFWVTGCGDQATTTSGATTTTKHGATTTSTTGGHETTSSSNGAGGGASSSMAAPSSSGGGAGGAGATVSTSPSGSELPFTGSQALPMLVAALALVGLGTASVLVARSRHGQV